jgi:UDP-N-acetylglucosamine 2-epimerase (non-hydrolysing)
MRRATLVLTDSGGVQEEAPALGVPSLVLRDRTERPEAIEAGLAVLVGPHRERIAAEGIRLLTDPERYKAMARAESPYGDGRAGERIAAAIDAFFRGARACEGSY